MKEDSTQKQTHNLIEHSYSVGMPTRNLAQNTSEIPSLPLYKLRISILVVR